MAGQILYKLSLDSTQFQNSLNKAQKNMQNFAKGMQDAGKSMSTYITAPILAMGGVGVMAWDKQAKAMAQVRQGLVSTGNAAGLTFAQLQSYASELQSKTLFGDEEILKNATAQLLTFTNIAGTEFKRAQAAALDLATRLDGDLKSSSIMLGKALNDPVQGLTAMRRVGISFSDSQTEMIKKLVESGQLMKAQGVILDELQRQYGGSAEAAVVGAGKITQLKNSTGDLMEEFGRIIMEYLTPLIDKFRELVARFQALDENTKRGIVKIAALAAAIGPLLLAFGGIIAIGAKVVGVFKAISLAMSLNPVGLVIAGIAALGAAMVYLWQNWEAVKERISDWSWWRNTLVEMVKFLAQQSLAIVDLFTLPFRKLASIIGVEIPSVVDTLQPIWDALDKLKTEPKQYEHQFGTFLDAVKGAALDAANALGIMNNAMGGGGMSAPAIKTMGETTGDKGMSQISAIGTPSVNTKGLEVNKLEAFAQKYRETAENIRNTTMAIGQQIADFTIQTVDGITKIVVNAGALIREVAMSAVDGFAAAVETAFSGGSFKETLAAFLTPLADLAIQVGKVAIAVGIGIEGIKKSLQTLNPVVAIAAGVALIALGSIAKAALKNVSSGSGGSSAASGPSLSSVPKLASGGLAYKPMLAVVGDNFNATSDPEVISPLSRLQDMINPSGAFQLPQKIELFAKGETLSTILELYNKRQNRFGR